MLTAFGYRFVRFINQRELTGWDRLIASAAVRHPDLPWLRFYAAGPGRAQQMLEAIIAEAIEAGTLRAGDLQEGDQLAG